MYDTKGTVTVSRLHLHLSSLKEVSRQPGSHSRLDASNKRGSSIFRKSEVSKK